MRRLLLLRHAKSSWDHGELDDVSRPLSPRGRKAAPLIGRHISGRGLVPDLVLCSTAERARQTLELVSAEWDRAAGDGAKVEMRASLYLSPPSELLAATRRLDDSIDCAMIIGHNPGMAMLAGLLAVKGDPRRLEDHGCKISDGSIGGARSRRQILEGDSTWNRLSPSLCPAKGSEMRPTAEHPPEWLGRHRRRFVFLPLVNSLFTAMLYFQG